MNYEEFLEKYKPIQNKFEEDCSFDGLMYETYGEELNYVKEQPVQNIWTIIEYTKENEDFITSYNVDEEGILHTWIGELEHVSFENFEDKDNEYIEEFIHELNYEYGFCLSNGYRTVNRTGYMITEIPWEEGELHDILIYTI